MTGSCGIEKYEDTSFKGRPAFERGSIDQEKSTVKRGLKESTNGIFRLPKDEVKFKELRKTAI